MKNRWIFLIILVPLVWGCSKFQNSRDLKFSGTLELTEHSLGAKVAGRISSLSVDEGSIVNKGEMIATLDRYEQAKRDYERTQEIFKQGGTTQQNLENSALTLEDQQVVSPVDGVVLVKVHEVGETLSAGSFVVVVGDRSSLWVRIYVPEGIINTIRMNQSATLRFDGLEQSFKGRVTFIASEAEFTPRNVQTREERVTQTFAVKITIDNPPDFLRPGVAAEVQLLTEG